MAVTAVRADGVLPEAAAHDAPAQLLERLRATRRRSLELAGPLNAEDMAVQPGEDASPTKWHLAHVTWFFETFILKEHLPGYKVFDDRFAYCFNSYYVGAGERHPRPRRGMLTRPTLDDVIAYRHYVDAHLEKLFSHFADPGGEVLALVELGINHEQQHQELLLTDILWVFSESPLAPAYRNDGRPERSAPTETVPPVNWININGGIFSVGDEGNGFAWDNERPCHNVLLHPFRIADRLVTNGEWLQFMEDGGYRNPLLWLSDGWARAEQDAWRAPLRWHCEDGDWMQMTLDGLQPINPGAPVSHISYFEADAYARWAGARLPTEFEWETAVRRFGNQDDEMTPGERLAPEPLISGSAGGLRQAFGQVWQWTASAYLPYPGYRVPDGTIGEYNGKFMVSQHVLRGSSCVTPPGHSRVTYRNFFHPHQRWQFTGMRLASEVEA